MAPPQPMARALRVSSTHYTLHTERALRFYDLLRVETLKQYVGCRSSYYRFFSLYSTYMAVRSMKNNTSIINPPSVYEG